MDEQLLTPDELARVLKVPTTWIYSRTRNANSNGFPVHKIGKYIRFSAGEVLNWLREQENNA